MKSHYYFICESTTICWKCDHSTPVYAIALPSKSYTWWEIEEDIIEEDIIGWAQEEAPGILTYVTEFSEDPQQPNNTDFQSIFYKDFSKSAQISYWMNHCSHCGIKQGDNALHHPGEAFWPLSIPAAKKLKVFKCLRPITARGHRKQFLCLEDIPEFIITK